MIVTREKIKNFSKVFMVGVLSLAAFIAFTGLVAATDSFFSGMVVNLLYSFGLITVLGHSIFGTIIALLLILPSYFFWLGAFVISYSFVCDKFNVPLKYSIP